MSMGLYKAQVFYVSWGYRDLVQALAICSARVLAGTRIDFEGLASGDVASRYVARISSKRRPT